MQITGTDRVADWRTPTPKYLKVCPECLSALVEEMNVISDMGHMVTWECGGCGRREMEFEGKQQKKLKTY